MGRVGTLGRGQCHELEKWCDQVALDGGEKNSLRFEPTTLKNLLQRPLIPDLMSLWKDFLAHLRHNKGEVLAYWMSDIDMVENAVLGLLRSSFPRGQLGFASQCHKNSYSMVFCLR